ncbi:hypothetical protein [Pseudonocardia xinjiangensis]|uniref:hypothetical protein n=1 Tax=Pseudonocardia xinjiangensis TaxID=75289 RepID=UPI0031D7D9CB
MGAGVEGEVLVAGGVVLGGVAGLLGEPGAGVRVGVVARCTVVLVGGAAGVPVAWARGASGAPGSPVAGVGGGAGGVVAVGSGVAEVSGRRWTVGDGPEAVEPVEVGAAVAGVDVAGVEGGRLDGAEGEAVAGGVDGIVLGGVAGLPGEPGAGVAAGARCTVVLVGSAAGVPVAWARGASGSPVAGTGDVAGGVVAVGGGVAEVSGRRWTAGEVGAAAVEPVEVGPAGAGVAPVEVVGAAGVEEVLGAAGVVLGGVAGLPGEPGAGVAAGARCTVVLVGGAAGVPVASLRGASGSPVAGVAGGVVAVGGGVAEVSGRRWTAGEVEVRAEGVPVAEGAPSTGERVGDVVVRGSPGAEARCTAGVAVAPPWSGVEGPGAPDVAVGAAGVGVTGTAGERGPSAACGERDVDGT